LINDSIMGPLDTEAYRALLTRIRTSTADFIGMTRNPDPRDHLQSYYLVFNQRLIHAPLFDELMRGVMNLPSKQYVIDCDEVWLTHFLESGGFTGESMFPSLSTAASPGRNDTIWNWQRLIELGFPFVKAAVLSCSDVVGDPRDRLPARYLAVEDAAPAPADETQDRATV
jgi:hypothetical protein